MTQTELYNALTGVGPPVAYREFTHPQEPPFIVYHFTDSDDLMADDSNYAAISGFDVELYTDKKDIDLESSTESALKDAGLTWEKTEDYIESERMTRVTYSIQIV